MFENYATFFIIAALPTLQENIGKTRLIYTRDNHFKRSMKNTFLHSYMCNTSVLQRHMGIDIISIF